MAARILSFEMIDVLVIGGIFREVLQGDSERKVQYGGSGLVAALSAGWLGANVALASYVGCEDEQAVRDELRVAGVNDGSVISLAGACGTFVFPTDPRGLPWPCIAQLKPRQATLRTICLPHQSF